MGTKLVVMMDIFPKGLYQVQKSANLHRSIIQRRIVFCLDLFLRMDSNYSF